MMLIEYYIIYKQWAIQFCNINNTSNRHRFVEEILKCPLRQSTLLIPLYCRLAAILKILIKDIGSVLSDVVVVYYKIILETFSWIIFKFC